MDGTERVARAELGTDDTQRTREMAPAQPGELAALRARLREVEVE